jgi:hypothetical protein
MSVGYWNQSEREEREISVEMASGAGEQDPHQAGGGG